MLKIVAIVLLLAGYVGVGVWAGQYQSRQVAACKTAGKQVIWHWHWVECR